MYCGFDHLYSFNEHRTKRISSWDKRGMNKDYILINPGEKVVLADIRGAGKITHMYCTVIDPVMLVYRKMVLKIYWDNEPLPSVEVPLGDFFCISHCTPRLVNSLLVTVNPGNRGKWCPPSYGMNAYFPMPFSERALFILEYQDYADKGKNSYPLMFWYHINYEEFGNIRVPEGRFHARWCREKLTKAAIKEHRNVTLWDGVNLDGKENYVILSAEGKGQLVGVHLQIDNVAGGWYGEGDDMVFIDGEKWPPSIHGTGTEEIFGGGACPCAEYSGPYTGIHLIENENFLGKNGMYRWYIADPLKFTRSILFSIEHGHANNFENDYSSVAYWYQIEPHSPYNKLPPVEERLPRLPEEVFMVEAKIASILKFQDRLRASYGESDAFGIIWKFVNDGAAAIVEKRYGDALGIYSLNLNFLSNYIK
ncbi:MAG: glycoside hydrolase family 172 protein [Thermodesulfovibrionales bacterium]